METTELIKTVGFPIFVSLWFMYLFAGAIKKMSDAVSDMNVSINENTKATEEVKNAIRESAGATQALVYYLAGKGTSGKTEGKTEEAEKILAVIK